MSDINVTVQDQIVEIDVIDTPVIVEVTNSPGQQGPAGVGVPVGGTTGQVLAKTSATNYATAWVNPSGGGVPYSGATGNVNLGEYELKAGQLTLDVSPTGTAAVGTTRWNDTTGVSETTLKGGNVLLRNGVDLVARVVNKVTPNTTLTKAAYQAVRVSGAQGQRLAVAFAQANNDANSADTIGLVCETIPTNQEGFIMAVGQLENINTTGSLQGETWVDGDVLYLSPTTAGAITNVKPTGNGHIVVIGYVEYAHANNGKIYIKILNGWELTELHDTEIVSPANNEALIYESSSALWKNKTIATALGYTPANAATTLTINGVTYDLSTSRTWTIAAGISGSGTAGQVTYWSGSSAVSGSNNLFWDNAQGRLGIGTNAPVNVLDATRNQNASTEINVTNTTSGTAANVGFRFTSDVGAGFASFGKQSSLLTTYKAILARDMAVYNSTVGGDIILFNDFATGRLKFATGGVSTSQMTLFANGNLAINNGVIDLGVRFGVVGDTLLRGSGATSATTALTVQNSSSTNLFTVRNDGLVSVTNALNQAFVVTSSATTRLAINNTNAAPNAGIQLQTNAVGNWSLANYIPGGGTNASFVFYNDRTATDSLFINGDTNNVGIRTNAPTARLDVPASVTTAASLRIRSGTAPTTPNDGDIWFDGTDIKMRIGGVTKTFTLI